MKMIKLTVVLCFCSSVVFAETTVEMIQQRAEAGDAEAQTLMGMMTFYGCQVPKDRNASKNWCQRAADQGDSFATENLFTAKKKREVPPAGSSNNPSSNADPWGMSKATLEKKVSNASSAEYKGDANIEDIVLHRAEYVGKVVKLRFRLWNFSTDSRIPFIYARDLGGNPVGRPGQCLLLSGQEALEWAVKENKRGYGVTSGAYALVDDNCLVALGTKQSQADNGYIYSW